MNWLENSLYVFELTGTAAFALAGAMVAIEKRTDLFGVIFLAITTAMGGGIIRDILMGEFPARFFSNHICIMLSFGLALLVFGIASSKRLYYQKNKAAVEHINLIFDALGLGAFAVSGTSMGIEAGFADNAVFVIFLGMTTAIGGGVIRDLMLGEIPFVLCKHIYAVAAISGAMAFYLFYQNGIAQIVSMLLGLSTTFVLRLCAIHFKWNLPKAF